MLDRPTTAEKLKSELAAAFEKWSAKDPRHHTKAEMARRCSALAGAPCSPQTVNSWFKTGRMDKAWLPIAAEVLGEPLLFARTPVDHQGGAQGQSETQSSNVGDPIPLQGARRIPVVGEVKGGDDGYFEELTYPVGSEEGYLYFPTTDPEAFALRVRGDSMHPRYRHGEFVVVEPSFEPQEGDDVVVCCHKGRKMLKMLNWRRGDEIQLLSVNSDHKPLTMHVSELQSIQLVGGRAAARMLRK